MLIATHAAAICDAIATTGRTVERLAIAAQRGHYGAIVVTPDQGPNMLADVGPAGVHAWRWRERGDWSRASVDTAAEALARSVGAV